jgi:hypothetical protein
MRKISKSLLAKQVRSQSRTNEVLQPFHPIDPDDIRAFEKTLVGSVVLPTDADYNDARQLWNPAFQDFPQIIVYCKVISDVRASLAFARQHDLWVVTRSGRHSTAGYSVNNSMVIDTGQMSDMVVDPDRNLAYVGPGTPFKVFNSVLNDYRLHVPGGACQDVCVAGFMMGGGFGFTSREFGMNCDSVIAVTVMLWDGALVRATADTNPDLFWAIRGGTGNNFGVLTQITYQLHDLYEVWGFHIKWPMDKAADALVVLQEKFMKDGVIGKMGYYAFVAYQGDQKVLLVSGLFHGSEEEGRALVQPLIDAGGDMENNRPGTYSEINSWLYDEQYDIPVVPDNAREDKQGGYIERVLTAAEWQTVLDYFETTPNRYAGIALEPYGGAINEMPVGKESNAFIHRSASHNFYVDVFWLSEEERVEVVAWLDGFMRLMEDRGFFIDECYQNYPRQSQTNYRWLYWGDNFNSLLFVKDKFDPENFFHYQQSVSPVPEGAPPSIRRDTSQSFFSDPKITYESYSVPIGFVHPPETET